MTITEVEVSDKVEKKIRVGICVHAFNTIHFDAYFNHMFCIGKWSLDYDIVMIGKCGLQAAQARESIVAHAVEHECEYLFFMDADHLFHVDSLKLLMENKEEAMTSGLVCKKGEVYAQVGWVVHESKGYKTVDLPLDGKVYEVGACAFGCTLINLKILQKLKKPYFRDSYDDVHKVNIRSDINLSNMIRDIGERVWIDTRVLVGHHGLQTVVYPQNANLYHKLRVLESENIKLKEGQQGVYYAS